MLTQQEGAGISSQLFERMDRVEEELRNQRELMDERFGFMEKRFRFVKQRFGDVDKRFEDLTEQMNRRFTSLTWMIGVGFVVITSLTAVFALLLQCFALPVHRNDA